MIDFATRHFPTRLTLAMLMTIGVLASCGGGSGSSTTPPTNSGVGTGVGAGPGTGTGAGTGTGSGNGTGSGTGSPVTPPAPPSSQLSLGPCAATGKGIDYQVGAGKTYTSLDTVPWENLKSGDTVRIFYSATPYKGKFAVFGQGTAAAPIRICGVRGPNNERPIIEGNGAVTRTNATYAGMISGDPLYRDIHEGRTVILLKGDANNYTSYPQHVQIDGLNIRNGYPGNPYANSLGQAVKYNDAFSACIWAARGQNITIADNEISGCPMAVYSVSLDDGDFAVTKNVRIAGNYMWGAGFPGEVHEHTTYTESSNIVIEFNRYGPLLSGADGNSIKDRSVGTVVRYNRIEDGAHAIDLVEAEDFPNTARADPAYRSTMVYGNLISKNGDLGSFIHYGGDHYTSTPGASWGEPIFRKGTLYFFNNTVMVSGAQATLFQLSTTEETAEVWNNVFVFASTIQAGYANMRQTSEINSPWTPGGIVNLGKNWVSTGWSDTDPYHTVPGLLNGTTNLIEGSSSPLDATTYVPLAGSAVIDAGVAGPTIASAYKVGFQISSGAVPSSRSVNGAAIDMGALER
jgi:hypothetical protein